MRYAKKVKLSTVLDQTEETEVPELTPDANDRLLKNYQEMVGEVPLPEAGPTEDQLAALQLRVIGRGGTPHADFAVLTPYGRRLQAALRARAWLLQTDGSYKAVIRPRPSGLHRLGSLLACLQSLRYPVGLTSAQLGQRASGRHSQCFGRVLRGIPCAMPGASRGIPLGPRSGGQVQGRALPKAQAHPHARRRAGLASNEFGVPPHCNLGSVCSRRQQEIASTGRRGAQASN